VGGGGGCLGGWGGGGGGGAAVNMAMNHLLPENDGEYLY